MPGPVVSIVIPTFNERENVRELLPAIVLAMADLDHEILVVDDGSPDGTAAEARALAPELPVVVIDRGTKGGLAGAVRAGLERASGEILVVMDADWSHDPNALPRLIGPILEKEADLVVGSRAVAGGTIEDWPIHRVACGRLRSIRPCAATRFSSICWWPRRGPGCERCRSRSTIDATGRPSSVRGKCSGTCPTCNAFERAAVFNANAPDPARRLRAEHPQGDRHSESRTWGQGPGGSDRTGAPVASRRTRPTMMPTRGGFSAL